MIQFATTLEDQYKKGPYKDFGLTFEEFCHAWDWNYSLGKNCDCKGCSTSIHVSESNLAVLYFDNDEGGVLFSTVNDNFEEHGFCIKLLDCSYCDIPFDNMAYIVGVLKNLHELPCECCEED